MQTATVKYQVATYSGTIEVMCNENDENDHVIAKAKQVLKRRSGPLPFGYQHFEVTERRDN